MPAKMLARLGASLPLIVLAAGAGAQQHAAPAAMTDEDMIKSAMAAAPEEVAKRATVVAIGADGKMRTLRQGDNGFTCLPDNPASPGPDPQCVGAKGMMEGYPRNPLPDTKAPYVMWAGTPYEHLMIPVR